MGRPPIGRRAMSAAERQRRRRAKLRPPIDPSKWDLLHEMHPDATTPEQQWQWSLQNAAGDAISMQAFWSRTFGDWRTFERPTDLLVLADQALAAWAELVCELKGE